MSHQCKSIGCNTQVIDHKQDFCTPCNYVHSILGQISDTLLMEEEDPEQFDTPLDTYAIHHAFDLQDPSGCLQRASHLILMSGQNNDDSYSPKGVDIVEARELLTRWLQLNEHE